MKNKELEEIDYTKITNTLFRKMLELEGARKENKNAQALTATEVKIFLIMSRKCSDDYEKFYRMTRNYFVKSGAGSPKSISGATENLIKYDLIERRKVSKGRSYEYRVKHRKFRPKWENEIVVNESDYETESVKVTPSISKKTESVKVTRSKSYTQKQNINSLKQKDNSTSLTVGTIMGNAPAAAVTLPVWEALTFGNNVERKIFASRKTLVLQIITTKTNNRSKKTMRRTKISKTAASKT